MNRDQTASRRLLNRRLLAALGFGFGAACSGAADAQTPAPAPSQDQQQPGAAISQQKPAAGPTNWSDGITLSGQIEAGITGNPSDPTNGINYGQLFTDKANDPILNQILLTAERDLDPKNTNFDVGFKFQLMYGSDARITHFLGEFDRLIHDRNQLDVVEANVTAHLPFLFSGGIDLKGGEYPTPLGFEVIDPKANPFYSHSYIFNYGLPLKHLGLLTTSHVSDLLDIYLAIDSGTNTTLGDGDNNGEPGGIFGFGLNNMLGGKLTVLALTHIGPDDATRSTPFGNSALRFYNDVVVTYKATDALTLTLEGNYVRDDGFHAEAYGGAGYASYALNDQVTLNARAEVYRDNNNFFVSVPVNNLDYVNSELGIPANLYTAPRPTTYGEFTIGATWKPTGLPKPVSGLLIRPEIRFDRALNGVRAFDSGQNEGQYTLATDAVLTF